MSSAPSSRPTRVAFAVVVGCLVAFFAFGAVDAMASVDIGDPASPLTSIVISPDLNCAVNHSGDASGEWFGDTACATELSFGGELFGPSSIPAGNSPTAFSAVSQSARTGTGTSGDPYTVVTVVDAIPGAGGAAVARVTETDSYVTGQESYTTSIQVQNTSGASKTGFLYHGGDCYLQNSDSGFGRIDSGAPSCVNGVDDGTGTTVPGPRIEQLLPLTAGSHYYEDAYSLVWSAMDAQVNLPDSCTCSNYQDNGEALNWPVSLANTASTAFSLITTFSPVGNQPLQTTKTADTASVSSGSADGYTITVSNPNASAATLSSISDTLPAGFTYTIGTSSGATISDPSVVGQVLTWNGSFNVPAGGSTTLHFGVTVSTTPGQYFNNAGASAGTTTVLATGNTAPVTVTQPSSLLTIGDASVNPEGDSGTKTASFTVTLSPSAAADVTVDYATGGGNATAGADYVSKTGTLTFTPGQTSKTIDVTVNGDTLDEVDETFNVVLSNASSNAGITTATGVGTIVDDDSPPTVSIGDVTKAEGDAGTSNANLAVTLSVASGRTVTVNYATVAGGTASTGTDYTATSGTLTFLAGETTKQVPVPVVGDTIDEPDETFLVDLSSPTNVTLADGQGQGTITDDDAPPAISIGDVSKTEGDSGTSAATFTVSLSNPSSTSITVDFATAAGTATAATDFQSGSGTVTFAPGETSKPVAVNVIGDTIDEVDETFTVGLTNNSSNSSIADNSATGTIVDDDGPGIAINDVTVNEGNSGTTPATFTVSLSVASVQSVTVHFATSDGTATAGSDYATAAGDLTFAPGETSKTVTVNVNGDLAVEANETFKVDLTTPSHASLADAQGVGTITNDDQAVTPPVVVPALSINDVTVSPEGNVASTPATFTVKLSVPTTVPVSVTVATANGTATAPADYTSGSGTLTFAPGETTKSVPVAVIGDTIDEPNETFTVNLTAPVNATIADASGLGTIIDDDLPEIGGPPVVNASGIFCGAQHRGKCKGLQVTAVFDQAGRGSWLFGAYNPSPGGKPAAAAASKVLTLGTVTKTIKKPGKVSFVFKLKPGARTNKLAKKVRAGNMTALRITERFTPNSGPKAVRVKTIKLRPRR